MTTPDQPHTPRPDHPPPEHRVNTKRTRLPDPFVPRHAATPREDSGSARGGPLAAVLGGLIFLALCVGFALIFTDLFR